MIVEITKRDIRLGKRNQASYCPFALAIARALKVPHKHVRVAISIAKLEKNGSTTYWTLPKRISKLIDKFDSNQRIMPTSFKLGKPSAVDRGFMWSQMNDRIYG